MWIINCAQTCRGKLLNVKKVNWISSLEYFTAHLLASQPPMLNACRGIYNVFVLEILHSEWRSAVLTVYAWMFVLQWRGWNVMCLCVYVACKEKMRGRGDACFPFGWGSLPLGEFPRQYPSPKPWGHIAYAHTHTHTHTHTPFIKQMRTYTAGANKSNHRHQTQTHKYSLFPYVSYCALSWKMVLKWAR